MEGVLRSVACWYEDTARKSKAELDALYRTRVGCGVQRRTLRSLTVKSTSAQVEFFFPFCLHYVTSEPIFPFCKTL